MANRAITIGCRDYDHTRALADGRVKPDGIEMKFVNISPPSQIFLRMLHDEEFDASEMSLSNYMIALGKTIIDSSPSRSFRRGFFVTRTSGSIPGPPSKSPRISKGKKSALPITR